MKRTFSLIGCNSAVAQSVTTLGLPEVSFKFEIMLAALSDMTSLESLDIDGKLISRSKRRRQFFSVLQQRITPLISFRIHGPTRMDEREHFSLPGLKSLSWNDPKISKFELPFPLP
jgi:hypothetical protein